MELNSSTAYQDRLKNVHIVKAIVTATVTVGTLWFSYFNARFTLNHKIKKGALS